MVAVGEPTEIIGLKNLLVIAIKIRNVGCEPLDEFFHMSVENIAVKDKIIKKLCTCVGFIRKGECIFENGTLARRKCHTAHTGTRINSAAAECHIAVTKIRLIKAETWSGIYGDVNTLFAVIGNGYNASSDIVLGYKFLFLYLNSRRKRLIILIQAKYLDLGYSRCLSGLRSNGKSDLLCFNAVKGYIKACVLLDGPALFVGHGVPCTIGIIFHVHLSRNQSSSAVIKRIYPYRAHGA